MFDIELSRSGDNAEYIILGRSIASGQGMMLIDNPDPIPATKFPPFFPAVLAAVECVAPGNVLAMKWLVLLFFAASVPLIYRLFLFDTPAIAVLVAVSCAASPFLLQKSHEVMSEVPYMALSVAALLVAREGRREGKALLSILLLSMAAYYTRTSAVALLAAIVISYLLRKDFRSAAILSAGMALAALPWMLYVGEHGGGIYAQTLFLADPYQPHHGNLDLVGAVFRIIRNLYGYAFYHIGRTVIPLLSDTNQSYTFLDGVGHLSVICCGLLYVGINIRRRVPLHCSYLLLYIGMLLCWPEAWVGIRLLIPIFPFLFYAFYSGGRWVVARVTPDSNRRKLICAAVVTGVLAANLAADWFQVQARETPPETWRDYDGAAEWIRKHTAADALIACRKPHLMFLKSERRAIRYAFATPEQVIRDLEDREVTHLVLDMFGEFDSNRRFLYPAVRQYKEVFKALHKLPMASVLGIDSSPSTAYQRIAEAHLDKNDLEQAVEALANLLRLYPDEVETGVMLSSLYIDLGQLEEAGRILNDLVRVSEPILAGEPVENEVEELSARIYEQLLRLDPDNPNFLNARAITILRQGNRVESIRILRDIATRHPETTTYQTNLAGALALAGRFQEAVDVLTRILEVLPDFRPAYSLLADIYTMMGEPEAAEKARRKADGGEEG